MLVREYTDADFAEVKRLYQESGFDYQLPSLSSSDFFSRRVVGGRDGMAMAAFQRLTSEVYLVANPTWRTPAWRMEALRQIAATGFADARDRGVKEVVGFLPPQVTAQFGSRLRRLGWASYKGQDWKCYTHEV